MGRHVSWISLILVSAAVASRVALSDEHGSAYSIEKLAAAVRDQTSSIDGLFCEYSVQYGDRAVPVNCRFARSGSRWHYAELSTGQQGQKGEHVFCYDGRLVYAFTVTHQEEKVRWGSVQLQDPREPGNLHPDLLLGENISNVGRSLVDILKSGRVTMSDVSLHDGMSGARLLVRAVPAVDTGPKHMKLDVAVTLDPRHDFLPREILVTEPAENITWPGWEQRWTILEYRHVPDGRTNRQRWFPVSGVLTQGSPKAPTIRMRVNTVEINEPMPLTLFRPEIPDGTPVADVTSDRRGKDVIQGSRFVEVKRAQDIAEAPEPVHRPTLPWLLLANLVVVIVLVSAFLWRRRLRRSMS